MLAATFLSCLVQSPAKVDVRQRAAVGEVMVRRLGEQFGVKITTDQSLADVPLVFSVKNVTFEEFRALSGPALDASWKETDDGWLLFRTSEQTRGEDARFVEQRKQHLRKEMSQLAPRPPMDSRALEELALKVKVAFDDDVIDLMFDNDVLDGTQALLECWSSLGPDYLASLPVGRRVTYSSDGVGGTRRLDALQSTIKRMSDEFARVEKEFRRVGAWDRLSSPGMGYTAEEFLRYIGVGKAERAVLQVATYIDYVELTLTGLDKDGNEVVSHYDTIECYDSESSPLLRGIKDQTLTFSKESMQVKASLMSLFVEESTEQSSAPFLDFLAAFPEKDLFSLDVTDALFAFADSQGVPVAARLSDDMSEELGLLFLEQDGEDKESINLVSALIWLDGYHSFAKTSAGVLAVSPERPYGLQTVLPRKAIGEYVRANRGHPNIDVSRLPSLFRPPSFPGGTTMAEIALVVHDDEEMVWRGAPYVLVAWQSLTGSQKLQAGTRQGVNLPVSATAALFRHQLIEDGVNYGTFTSLIDGLDDEEESHSALQDLIFADIAPGVFDKLQANIRAENATIVFMASEGEEEAGQVTAEDLADAYKYWEDEKAGEGRRRLQTARFRVEAGTKVVVSVLTPVGVVSSEDVCVTTNSGRANLRFDQLPAEWRLEFERELRRARDGVPQSGSVVIRRSIG